jgi:hypothetical protein
MDEMNCIICEASFRPQAMVKDKCVSCFDLYPKARSRKDILPNKQSRGETLTESRVKDIIFEILEDANIKRHECEKCKKLYFRTAPAQKFCKACKESK